MKFLLTKEVGKLARWLRTLGYDTVYYTHDNTALLELQALREARVIITRNKVLYEKTTIKSVYVEAEKAEQQLRKVISSVGLKADEEKMLSRCSLCNTVLVRVDKDAIQSSVPVNVFNTRDQFMRCVSCQRIYWQGSHWGNIKQVFSRLTQGAQH